MEEKLQNNGRKESLAVISYDEAKALKEPHLIFIFSRNSYLFCEGSPHSFMWNRINAQFLGDLVGVLDHSLSRSFVFKAYICPEEKNENLAGAVVSVPLHFCGIDTRNLVQCPAVVGVLAQYSVSRVEDAGFSTPFRPRAWPMPEFKFETARPE